MLLAAQAHGRDCSPLLEQNLRYAQDPVFNLYDLQRLERYTDTITEHADRVFIEPDQAVRVTTSLTLGTHLMLGFRKCTQGAEIDGDVGAAQSGAGGLIAVDYAPLDLGLTIFTTGRLVGGRFDDLVTEIEPKQGAYPYFLAQGLLGGRVQITRWLEVGYAETGASSTQGDPDHPLRDEVALIETPTDRYYSLGVPALGLRLWFTEDNIVDVRAFELTDLQLTETLEADLQVRRLLVEDRVVVTPKLLWWLNDRETMRYAAGVEMAVESDPLSMRHVSLVFENLMASWEVKSRTSYSRIGVRIEQSAALSVHRGQTMRQESDASMAVGARYESRVGLQSSYVYFFFNFGMSFNDPEMLDLLPHLINHGMLDVGMNIASRL